MRKATVKVLCLISYLGELLLIVGLTGCAGERYTQSTRQRIDDNPTAPSANNQSQDQRIEDSRTAERVREGLAAAAAYRYDGVKVIARNGVVELSGFVNTRAQRNSAGEIAGQAVGVKGVENNLTVKD